MYPNGQVAVNVADFLNNPSRVTRVVAALTQDRTIADYAFGQGDANQGAVVYDMVTGQPVDTDRDVEVIAPGAEFPEIGVLGAASLTAKVSKYGGEAPMTYEAIRRNENDTLQRRLTILANLIIKRVNGVAVNALVSNPYINTLTVGSSWLGAPAGAKTGDAISDLFTAKAQIDDNDLGYIADTALINPLDAQRYFLGIKSIRDQVTVNTNNNPVLSGDMGRIANVDWIKSSAIPQGTIYTLQRGVTGSIRDEEGGTRTNVYDLPARQVRVVQGWRSIVPIITDPKSVTKITGFDAD